MNKFIKPMDFTPKERAEPRRTDSGNIISPCGCEIQRGDTYDWQDKIVFCDTHAVAPELLAACERISLAFFESKYQVCKNDQIVLANVLSAAIAKAKAVTS